MSSSDCPRKGKWIGGCRFEGRWDEFPSHIGEIRGSTSYAVALIKAARRRVYVRECCTTCGKTIEREKA